nr:hypothetical protein [Burkholderia cepacia]
MNSGNRSLRSLVIKWFGSAPLAPICVTEFSRTRTDRTRYVRIGIARPQGWFAIVFFRHDDGSWNVFPPNVRGQALGAYRHAA